MEEKSNLWARQVITEANPCQWCYKWGHWVEDCPLKKQKKLPVIDPRLQNPGYWLKRSSIGHLAFLKQGKPLATVASIKKQPGSNKQPLLDSGATNSVTNNVHFFTSMRPISMNLMVASTDQFLMMFDFKKQHN